jgi:hypothetical protein
MKEIYKSIKESDVVQEQATILQDKFSEIELYKLTLLAVMDAIEKMPIPILEALRNAIQKLIDSRSKENEQ